MPLPFIHPSRFEHTLAGCLPLLVPIVLAMFAPILRAQQAPAEPLTGAQTPAEPMVSRPGATGLLEVKPEQLPPQLRLGRRVEEIRHATAVISTLVVVRDAESYIEAIARWTPTLRYPVLLDDGSPQSAEDIARFTRGFKPTKVVRWATRPVPQGTTPRADGLTSTTAPALIRALARSWGWDESAKPQSQSQTQTQSKSDDPDALAASFLADLWRRQPPPGIVLTHQGDTVWPAALALAAFRGQPLVALPSSKIRGNLSTIFSAAEIDSLAAEIDHACDALSESSGLQYKGLGDQIDALTLCLNIPVKAWATSSDQIALTDRLGRLGTTAEPGPRWAWAGQIFGSAPQSSYRAMSALFLTPASAWLFDGYPDEKVWNEYDCTSAAETLRTFGFSIQLDDTPKQSDRDWRARANSPLAADLVLVTTKGNADFFDLQPGTCKPGDVPILLTPVAVHFTHSWSAQWPANRDTIAGRWFERGAYSYVGSVQEPYLQSFVVTKGLALRLTAGGPWGLFARMDAGPFAKPWRIAVFGDPLAVLGDPLKRVSSLLPLDHTTDLAEASAASIKEGRFAEAVNDLVMLGRDDVVRRLVAAMRTEKNSALTPDIIAAAILPAFRTGQREEMFELFAQLSEGRAKDPILRDALWLAAPALLERQPARLVLETLRKNLRDDQIERDATELARAWALQSSRADALVMLQELRPRYTETVQKQALEKAISAYRAR